MRAVLRLLLLEFLDLGDLAPLGVGQERNLEDADDREDAQEDALEASHVGGGGPDPTGRQEQENAEELPPGREVASELGKALEAGQLALVRVIERHSRLIPGSKIECRLDGSAAGR